MNMTPKRSSFGTYMNNLVNGVTSMFEGMSITLASMFFRAQTVQYPDVNIHSNEELVKDYKGNLRGMPSNYRGMLHVEMNICTACMICMKACPIDCIAITNVKCDKRTFVGAGGKKAVQTRAATRFDIDLGKCMFCGLCSLPCPTGAIHHTTQFEFVPDNLNALVYRFVSPEEGRKAEARAKEIEAEEKAAKAAKAKAEAEAKTAEPKPENN